MAKAEKSTMIHIKRSVGLATCVALLFAAPILTAPAWSAIEFNQNVTGDVIFGSGNANGSFTTDRNNGVELGLRAKLRHNAAGSPENTFNSNGDGTYSFASGVAPTQVFPTAVWSLEWSINSDSSTMPIGRNLSGLTYLLSIDSDPSASTNFMGFDPINVPFADHAIGTNSTTNGGGTVAPDAGTYATLIGNNNLAQNSWKAHWIMTPMFDPTADGIYDFQLQAFDGTAELASTNIQVLVGDVGVVPEPMSLLVWSMLGVAGLVTGCRRQRSV